MEIVFFAFAFVFLVASARYTLTVVRLEFLRAARSPTVASGALASFATAAH